jgi:endonuclease/exonuclease/phosphatase family metal-dependent hydrolase
VTRRFAFGNAVIRGALAFVLLAAACGAGSVRSSSAAASPPVDGVRLMTWNIWGQYADGKGFDEQRGIAARIRELHPDVVGLSEAQDGDISRILSLLGGTYADAERLPETCDKSLNVTILVRRSGGAVERVVGAGGVHIADTCKQQTDPDLRALVWVDVRLRNGVTLRAYVTHLSSFANTAVKRREIDKVRRTIAAHAGSRWALAGDMNAQPGDADFTRVMGRARKYRDAYAVVHPGADRCTSMPSTEYSQPQVPANQKKARDCGYTFWYTGSWQVRAKFLPWIALDHVFLPATSHVRVGAARVPQRTDADWARAGRAWYRLSGHLPMIVDLRVS